MAQAEAPATPNGGSPLSIIGFGTRRRMQPPATRRAVAFAIELEHTHDRLQRIIGHSLPLGARIAHLNATKARPGRLSLPKVLDAAALDRLIQERAQAVERMRALFEGDDASTDGGMLSALRLIDQAALWREVEQRPTMARRTRVHLADPRSWRTPEENLQHDIARAADTPETEERPAAPPRGVWTPQELPRGAYSIDVMTDGLLTRHGVDRVQLYEELQAIAGERQGASVELASHALRSNTIRTLRALGHEFPPATLQLRGWSLDATRIDIVVETPAGARTWTYRGGNDPTVRTTDMLRGERIDGFELQPLATALQDPGLHPALLTRRADRRLSQDGGEVMTILSLFPRFTHLDAPEAPPGIRPAIGPAQAQSSTPDDHMRLREVIANRLYAHDLHHRFRLNRGSDGTYEIVVGEQSEPNPLHHYVLSGDDIEAGDRAIAARVDEIADLVRAAQAQRLERLAQRSAIERERAYRRNQEERHRRNEEAERERRRVFNERMEKAREEAKAERHALVQRLASSPSPQRSTRSMVLLDAFGEKAALDHHGCQRVDAMMRTLCESDWRDVGKARSNRVALVVEQGVLIVASATFGNIAYQRTGTNRDAGGITHVIGTFVIPMQTTQAWIDGKRDGRVGDVFNWEGALGACQIVRMHQAEDGIHVVARLTVSSADE